MRAYIAGPMRGYPLYNFPAFDAARDALIAQGHEVISPADLDRAFGVDELTNPLPEGFLHICMRRDIEALLTVDTIVMLPGWSRSTGANIELTVAQALGLDVRFWDPDDRCLRGSVFS